MKKWVLNYWDDVLVYLTTLVGIFIGQALPAFKAGGEIDFMITWPRVVVAAFVSFIIMLKTEKTSGIEQKIGKRRNLQRRLLLASTQSFSLSTLAGMV